jgi:hypothetical protein
VSFNKSQKRKAKLVRNCEFSSEWEEFPFTFRFHGKPVCLVCSSTIKNFKAYDLKWHMVHNVKIGMKSK